MNICNTPSLKGVRPRQVRDESNRAGLLPLAQEDLQGDPPRRGEPGRVAWAAPVALIKSKEGERAPKMH